MDRRKALSTLGLSSLAATALVSCGRREEGQEIQGREVEPEAPADDGLVELLFVQESQGVRFDENGMTLVNVNPQTLFFSDRPDDIAGYLNFEEFVQLVGEGPDNFSEEPPNGTLVILESGLLEASQVVEAVVVEVTEKPRVDGPDLVYPAVNIIQGDPPAVGGFTAFFIDTIGRPMSPGSVAGVHRRHRRRRRRRVVN